MEKDLINRYIINFRRFVAPYTKEDVSIKAVVYPYTNGAIIVFQLDFNSSNNTDYRSLSSSMQEAMKRTNLFDNPQDASDITSTKVIVNKNTIIVIKGDDAELWQDKSAKTDVSNIISSIEGRK